MPTIRRARLLGIGLLGIGLLVLAQAQASAFTAYVSNEKSNTISVVDIDKLDIRLVVDFVIAGFEWHAPRAESMVFRDQLFGDDRIVDALPDLARDEI